MQNSQQQQQTVAEPPVGPVVVGMAYQLGLWGDVDTPIPIILNALKQLRRKKKEINQAIARTRSLFGDDDDDFDQLVTEAVLSKPSKAPPAKETSTQAPRKRKVVDEAVLRTLSLFGDDELFDPLVAEELKSNIAKLDEEWYYPDGSPIEKIVWLPEEVAILRLRAFEEQIESLTRSDLDQATRMDLLKFFFEGAFQTLQLEDEKGNIRAYKVNALYNPFSFESLCREFGLDADAFRDELATNLSQEDLAEVMTRYHWS
jgi:hypothetical protein